MNVKNAQAGEYVARFRWAVVSFLTQAVYNHQDLMVEYRQIIILDAHDPAYFVLANGYKQAATGLGRLPYRQDNVDEHQQVYQPGNLSQAGI